MELRFHPRRYEQPPTEGLRGNKTPGGSPTPALKWPNSSSDDLRADATATSSSPTPPLEGRGQAIKAKEPEARSTHGGGDPVGGEDFFSRRHLSADDGNHLPTGRFPLGSSRTSEAPTSAQRRRTGAKAGQPQKHERRPSSARRLGRSLGAHGATTALTVGGDTGSRTRPAEPASPTR
jgi:hypothetical protein